MSINNYMRSIDINAFKLAADLFKCIIMVRRLNPASLPFVGKQGYMPKSIFCKAKTAKNNVIVPGTGQMSNIAGLVADPTLPGILAGFAPSSDAEKWWHKFLAQLGVKSLRKVDLYSKLPEERGGFYTVQDEVSQPHYGALIYCPFIPSDLNQFTLSTYYLTNRFFIHGDYDLYGLIPTDEREMRLVTRGQLLGQANFYTPLLQPVQNFINQRIGLPMVQHGSQENIGHSDDSVDIFWPDGRISERHGIAKLIDFYKVELGNRGVG